MKIGVDRCDWNEIQNLAKIENFPELYQENSWNQKYAYVQKKTWTLPQIWRRLQICGAFVFQMNIYWTTDWNEKTGSRKKNTLLKI
jgi:hypothetical protein